MPQGCRGSGKRLAFQFRGPYNRIIDLDFVASQAYVEPGGGSWLAEKSLLAIEPSTAYVTAFRTTKQGREIIVNDLSGKARQAVVSTSTGEKASVDIVPYGVATLHV